MKTCSKCLSEKNESEFSVRNKNTGLLNVWCRDCFREYDRSRYLADRERLIGLKKRLRKKKSAEFREFKESLSCLVCGESTPECLDFHHVDGEKYGNISTIVNRWSVDRFKKELEKCVVLCANCHRKVHSGRIEIPWRRVAANPPTLGVGTREFESLRLDQVVHGATLNNSQAAEQRQDGI